MRRRLAWSGAFVLVAALVAGLIVAFPSPGPRQGEKTSPGGDIVAQETPTPFASREQEVLVLARRFVQTAVARKHLDDSWELVCPVMKQGYTKSSWTKGDIPVVPFPVRYGKWHLSYSYATEIDVQVALYASPKEKLKPVVFDLTIQPCGKEAGKRWLVSSFIPTPSAGGDFGTRASRYNPFGIGTKDPEPLPNHASGTWLLLPGGIVGGTLLIVFGLLGLRSFRGKRAYAAYVRERQMSSSRPS